MAEYEFTAEQNTSIDAFRQKLLHISISCLILGALLLHLSYTAATGVSIYHLSSVGFVYMILAVVYFRPIDNFKRITTTKGNDVFEMMIAMDDLRIAFTIGQVLFLFLGALALAQIIW